MLRRGRIGRGRPQPTQTGSALCGAAVASLTRRAAALKPTVRPAACLETASGGAMAPSVAEKGAGRVAAAAMSIGPLAPISRAPTVAKGVTQSRRSSRVAPPSAMAAETYGSGKDGHCVPGREAAFTPAI